MKQKFKTRCSYCGVGCGIIVHKDYRGQLEIEGDADHPVNKGKLCAKGLHINYTVMDQSDRLLYPEMRINKKAPLERVSWDSALDRAAAVFKTLINKYGPDSVAFYSSGQLLTEEQYLINKLVKGFIGTNNIDANSRLCLASNIEANKIAFGKDIITAEYSDIDKSDCIMISGSNLAWCHPILFQRIEEAKAENPDLKVIVVDPRKTQTGSIADLHLQINPGSDISLYNAIARYLIEKNYIDTDFIDKYTENFDALKNTVMEKTIEEASIECGITEEDITQVGELLGNSKTFLSLWATGINQSSDAVNKNLSLMNLSLILGQIGKPGSGLLPLAGQANDMGIRDTGSLSNLIPAYKNFDNLKDRIELSEFWKSKDLSDKPGLTAVEMFEAIESGKIKAIWIIGTNPMASLANVKKMENALQKAKFVVVQDISKDSLTLKYADLVLPAAGWSEKQGTMVNAEKRINYLPKIVTPPGEALADSEIICKFADKMGFTDQFTYKDESLIFHEFTLLTKGSIMDLSGLNYLQLKSEGSVIWPCNDNDKTNKEIEFYRDNGKAYLKETKNKSISKNGQLHMITGRSRDQWQSMTRTGKITRLRQSLPAPVIEIHPNDAQKRNINFNDIVEVESKSGKIKLKAEVTDFVKEGSAFVVMHWNKIQADGEVRTNNITDGELDPISNSPDYIFTPIEIKKAEKSKQRIIVIGAGIAALNFIRTYRYINLDDEIHVFSKEKEAFYNRVMLPEYLTGNMSWDTISNFSEEDIKSLNITLHLSNGIDNIDREKKQVLDEKGELHNYDKLILATGSSAPIPKFVPQNLKGVFSIRVREDVEYLKDYLNEGQHCVIVGGGPLGLEMAASLRQMNIRVTIIQRSSILMSKQLDEIGGKILHNDMISRGVDIIYNDEIQSFLGDDKINSIRLASGKYIQCSAVIFGVGIRANISLAQKAGLECGRGIIVNSALQTSDANIFALGEIAEFNHVRYGIVAAAEEQAEIAAQYVAGDTTVAYKGSVQMNILKVPGLDLCSIGQIIYDKTDPNYDEVVFYDKERAHYKKCIIYKDRLIACILIGDKSEFFMFKGFIADKLELREQREKLLRSNAKPAAPVLGKVVCSCSNVGEGNISMIAGNEGLSLDDLFKLSGAGQACGGCKGEITRIYNEKQSEKMESAK